MGHSTQQQSRPGNGHNPFNQPQQHYTPQPLHTGYGQNGMINSQGGFPTSSGPAPQPQSINHHISTSAPSSLSMFDPLHPASQQTYTQQPQHAQFHPSLYQQQQFTPQHQFTPQPQYVPPTNGSFGSGMSMPGPNFGQTQSYNGMMGQPMGQNAQAYGTPWNGGMGQMNGSGQMGQMGQSGMSMGYTSYPNGMR
jgi:hypothetical protein